MGGVEGLRSRIVPSVAHVISVTVLSPPRVGDRLTEPPAIDLPKDSVVRFRHENGELALSIKRADGWLGGAMRYLTTAELINLHGPLEVLAVGPSGD
ncbi:MAG: hypothetical protein JOY61_08760 [Chloroflexi bacterium]|nr:hypothetical protein [Chloroflexota bacterium]